MSKTEIIRGLSAGGANIFAGREFQRHGAFLCFVEEIYLRNMSDEALRTAWHYFGSGWEYGAHGGRSGEDADLDKGA